MGSRFPFSKKLGANNLFVWYESTSRSKRYLHPLDDHSKTQRSRCPDNWTHLTELLTINKKIDNKQCRQYENGIKFVIERPEIYTKK